MMLVEKSARRGEAVEVTDHRYKIGQKVILLTAKRLRAPNGSYHVVERLPVQNGEPRYSLEAWSMTVIKRSPMRKTWVTCELNFLD